MSKMTEVIFKHSGTSLKNILLSKDRKIRRHVRIG